MTPVTLRQCLRFLRFSQSIPAMTWRWPWRPWRPQGETASRMASRSASEIPPGHAKVALRAMARGEAVRKYGWPIGHATMDIAAGEHVHSHNLATNLSGLEAYAYAPAPPEPLAPATGATFQGYRRSNGRVGTRNEIWILCTVGCVARTAREDRAAAEASVRF